MVQLSGVHCTIIVDTQDYYINTGQDHQVYCFYDNTCIAACRHTHEMFCVLMIFNYWVFPWLDCFHGTILNYLLIILHPQSTQRKSLDGYPQCTLESSSWRSSIQYHWTSSSLTTLPMTSILNCSLDEGPMTTWAESNFLTCFAMFKTKGRFYCLMGKAILNSLFRSIPWYTLAVNHDYLDK